MYMQVEYLWSRTGSFTYSKHSSKDNVQMSAEPNAGTLAYTKICLFRLDLPNMHESIHLCKMQCQESVSKDTIFQLHKIKPYQPFMNIKNTKFRVGVFQAQTSD